MDDVNLLPEELRQAEQKELKKKENDSRVVPMSTPVLESERTPHRLGVAQSRGTPPTTDTKLHHVREQSDIGVSPQGKIVHEAAPQEPLRRAPAWWRRLWPARITVKKVSAPLAP